MQCTVILLMKPDDKVVLGFLFEIAEIVCLKGLLLSCTDCYTLGTHLGYKNIGWNCSAFLAQNKEGFQFLCQIMLYTEDAYSQVLLYGILL